MKKFIVAAAVVALSSGTAYAASGSTSTATGAASATVVSPIVLTHTAGATLGFGKFTVGTGGTVVVTSAGAGSATGDVGLIPGNTYSADAFTVAGDGTRTFSISTGGGTVVNGAKSMAFTTTPSAATGTLVAGAASFTVGGTLTVVGTETAGAYVGSYTATVTYN